MIEGTHPQTLSSAHIAIVGAGLAGRLLAWRLAKLGHHISLFDSGSISSPKNAAHTAAAMLSPLSEVVVSERAIYDMGVHSMTLWESWLSELNLLPLYHRRGSLVVAHPQDEAELIQFHQELRYHLGNLLGGQQSQHERFDHLNRQQLHQLEPSLASHFEHGLFLPNEAWLDNRAFLAQTLNYLQSHPNVRLFEHTPISFTPSPHCEQVDTKPFNLWFDCRGTGAKPDRQVRGVRGEVLWVETAEVNLSRPIRLMHPRYKLYVVPKPNNQYIVGATEIESNDTSPMSVQSSLELCSALYTLNPAFAEARIVEMDTNLRPALLDNMPCVSVQEHPMSSSPIIHINGLYRHGYLLAPSVIEHAIHVANLSGTSSPFSSQLSRNTLAYASPVLTPQPIEPEQLEFSKEAE